MTKRVEKKSQVRDTSQLATAILYAELFGLTQDEMARYLRETREQTEADELATYIRWRKCTKPVAMPALMQRLRVQKHAANIDHKQLNQELEQIKIDRGALSKKIIRDNKTLGENLF